MIDTIRCRVDSPWNDSSFSTLPPFWNLTSDSKLQRDAAFPNGVGVSTRSHFLHHAPTGLRIHGNDSHADWFEVSLPRLVHPDNSHLITNQHQLDDALSKLRSHLSSFFPHCDWSITRLDLVWHFDVPCRPFLESYASLRLPGYRSLPVVYPGESVTWKNTRSSVCMYDKGTQMKLSSGPLRIEYRLKDSSFIRNAFRDKVFDFKVLHDYYARTIALLTPVSIPQPSIAPTMVDFLARLMDAGCTLRDGQSAVEFYFNEVCKSRHSRKLRRDVQARALHFRDVNFREMLSNQGLLISIDEGTVYDYQGDTMPIVHANGTLTG